LLIVPYVAERIQFALTRGDQLAKAEVARAQLAGMTQPVSRFRLVAQSIEPRVVGVDALRTVSGRGMRDEWSGGPVFQNQTQGSGVIIDPAGYVLTNFHVIDDASQVTVQLSDGRTVRSVRVVGADPYTDLAVLKIDAGALIAAPWGDSDQLEVGDEVLAVGNPFGLARTVTAGIISAKDRIVTATDRTRSGFQEFLQTDAAVNPGNSGGPLVNLQGEVVGINTAIVGEIYQGISFAIPSRLAQEVYEKLVAEGRIARGWLGVAMDDLTEDESEQLGLEKGEGVRVHRVVPDSPASAAGIRAEDVIVRWNDHAIDGQFELSRAVARTAIGSDATVELIRGGERLELIVTVGERPAEPGG
jgi:S1-C subfamily serine protease